MVLKSIIQFLKGLRQMSKFSILYENYEQWLTLHQNHNQKKIIHHFTNIAQNFNKTDIQINLKTIYLQTHIHFLIEQLISMKNHIKQTFSLIIIILNFILKLNNSIRISLTKALIYSLKTQIEVHLNEIKAGQMASNIVWFICKCLQGTNDKKNALQELGKSGLINLFLEYSQLDIPMEKIISMLLHQISKNQLNTNGVTIQILKYSHKFKHPDSIGFAMNIIKNAGLEIYQTNKDATNLLGILLVTFMKNNCFGLTFWMEHINLIAIAAIQNPKLCKSLQIESIIQKKLSINNLNDEPMLNSIIKLIQLQELNEKKIENYLNLASLTLTNNVVSRRIFILFHQQMTEQQLTRILSEGLPNSFINHTLSNQQFENGLKLLICLKRSAIRLGLNRVFWYACKSSIQKILTQLNNFNSKSSKELFQIFEEVMKEQIQLLIKF